MYPFVESIALVQGEFRNLSYHDARVERTQRHFYGGYLIPSLREVLFLPPGYQGGVWKCRVEYGRGVGTVSYTPYVPRIVQRIFLVEAPEVDYSFKYNDRSALTLIRDRFFLQTHLNGEESEIIFVQNGYLTDSGYANVVLQMEDGVFYTPDTPLLSGTMRAYLLDKMQIKERRLTVSDARSVGRIMLINAMLPLDPERLVPCI